MRVRECVLVCTVYACAGDGGTFGERTSVYACAEDFWTSTQGDEFSERREGETDRLTVCALIDLYPLLAIYYLALMLLVYIT